MLSFVRDVALSSFLCRSPTTMTLSRRNVYQKYEDGVRAHSVARIRLLGPNLLNAPIVEIL